MTEYTVHVQVPDAAIGAVLHEVLLHFTDVTCTNLRSSGGTWLSFGLNKESDDDATMRISAIRYHASRAVIDTIPEGYDKESLLSFETAHMIIAQGRVVIHSEGI